MHALIRRTAELPRIPLAVFGLSLALVIGGRLFAPLLPAADGGLPTTGSTAVDDDPVTPADASSDGDPLAPPDVSAAGEELARIRANVTFWGDRLADQPGDFISATRLAGSEIELARATGDVTRYLAADAAVDAALAADPTHVPARALAGVVDVALHRFADARDAASALLADRPNDPVALATLGDATLELGDLAGAAGAYERLVIVADSAAARIRAARLAFVEGRAASAVDEARTAVTLAIEEGAAGGALAWYQVQLADLLLATGDRPAAEAAITAALDADAGAPLALAARARLAAADGRIDAAIDDLDAAIRVIPYPDLLARRADLFELRAGDGDAQRAADDRATVLAIAQAAGTADTVYDRTLAVFLATTGMDPARALRLAEAEIEIRTDAYGYDALGWALLANGRATEADAALTTALATGIRDARILYHAGMAAIAAGDDDRGRDALEAAIALDPTFDPAAVARIRTTLGARP